MPVYYTYLIRHKPSGRLYYGSKTGRHADPNQLFNPSHKKPYYTSSKIIASLLSSGSLEDFQFSVRKTFKTPDLAKKTESRCIRFLLEKYGSDKVLNKNVGGSKFNWGKNGRIWITNGKKNKLIDPLDKIRNGWFVGFTHQRWINHIKTKSIPSTGRISQKRHHVFYDPTEGAVFTGPWREENEFLRIERHLLKYGIPSRFIPKQHRIIFFTGERNVRWDGRIPAPTHWVKGYKRSTKQIECGIKSARKKVGVSVRLDRYDFKHIETGTIFENKTIREMVTETGIAYTEFQFIVDYGNRTCKGYTVFDKEFGCWRNEIPRKKRAYPRRTCPHCGKLLDEMNYAKYHGSKCKLNLQPSSSDLI